MNELQRKIVVASSAELKSKTTGARTLLLVLGVFGLVAGWPSLLDDEAITRPIHEAVRMAKTVASGDLGQVSQQQGRSGNC